MSTHHLIIKSPLITEQNNRLREMNKYVFEVDIGANKQQIKKAVETLFKVNVVSVNTLIVKGKKKRVGRYVGFKSDWKKAIIRIAAGQTIDKFGEV